MKLNIFSLIIIVIMFFGFTGTFVLIGIQSISTNDNLETESVLLIAGLNSDLQEQYDVKVENGSLIGYEYNESTSSFDAAESFEREFLESRTLADDISVGTSNIGKIPESVISGLNFTSIGDWSFYLGLLSTIIGIMVALSIYKSWKTGEVNS